MHRKGADDDHENEATRTRNGLRAHSPRGAARRMDKTEQGRVRTPPSCVASARLARADGADGVISAPFARSARADGADGAQAAPSALKKSPLKKKK